MLNGLEYELVCLLFQCRKRHDSYQSASDDSSDGSSESSDGDRKRRSLKSSVTAKVGQFHVDPIVINTAAVGKLI